MRILLPKKLYKIHPSDGPLFFFAGPVRGGDDWQESACIKLSQLLPDCHIALPCRYEPGHPLLRFEMKEKEDGGDFIRQLFWERHYMDLAAKHGCLMFWLPCESLANPREEGPYAQDTRGELGEIRGRMMYERNLRVVIGAEPKFPGLEVIERNFEQALTYPFPVFRSLDETIAEAARRAMV